MASDEEEKAGEDGNFEWNVENEIRLFEAMIGLKPVGINKHFYMACISEKFENLIGRPVSSEVIWKHLSTMFDLAALDKKEVLPFPNEQEEFCLPESEYLELINEKLSSKTEPVCDTKDATKEGRTTPKTLKDSTPAKESASKKEKRTDSEESGNDAEKKEAVESESESKKVKLSKEDKVVKTRGKRSMKEKKSEEESSLTPVSAYKKEEESPQVVSSNKKEKQPVGKRTLRSRADDLINKSVTPPPTKRPRRI